MTALWEESTTTPPLLDVASLAERLGVTERFVRRLVAERRVPFLKLGKFIRFDPRAIESWLDSATVPEL
jgi:excisionase family DNA binding protein